MNGNTRVTLLVAHRHTMFRQALRAVLTTQGGFDVVAEAGDGKETVEMAERLRPNVAVIDAQLGIISGLEATRLIGLARHHTRVVLLAAFVDDDLILSILRAGASCVLGEADIGELLLAVRVAHEGGAYLSPKLTDRVVQNYMRYASSADEGVPVKELLSIREREVLQAFANGEGNRAIGERLMISVKTVEAHKAHIMSKLGVKGGLELLKYAARQGLIELDVDEPA